jgi:hypothetical protein
MSLSIAKSDLPIGSLTPATCLGLVHLLLRSTATSFSHLDQHDIRQLRQIATDSAQCAFEGIVDPLSPFASFLKGHPSLAWTDLIQAFLAIPGDSLEIASLRQAAHTALQLRNLQSRFSDQLDMAKRQVTYQAAYGLSHELNNPLAIIANRASQLRRTVGPTEQAGLDSIIDNARRGAEMLGDMMLVARPPQPQPRLWNLAELGRLIRSQSENWAGKRLVCIDFLWPQDGSCVVDAEQLQEVIWAILRNALEVSQAGQRVAISGKVDAESLTIEICDQGPGMSPEAIQHCFDLFYSGREAGRGMGLGLAKARRLVDLAGGRLTADNRPGGGCRFSLSLPVG